MTEILIFFVFLCFFVYNMQLGKSISFRQLALEQRWTELYEEVKQMKVQKTNKIFDEKRNHKVHPSRQHVVQLT